MGGTVGCLRDVPLGLLLTRRTIAEQGSKDAGMPARSYNRYRKEIRRIDAELRRRHARNRR